MDEALENNDEIVSDKDERPKEKPFRKKHGFRYVCYLIVKRFFDFISSLIVSLLLLLPMIIIAIVIFFESGFALLQTAPRRQKGQGPQGL